MYSMKRHSCITFKCMNNKEVPTNTASGVIIGFLAGLSAGAIMGVLFAPKKGDETRRELREKAMAARNRIQSRMATRKDKLKRGAEKATTPSSKAKNG